MSELSLIYVNASQIGYGRLGVELQGQLTSRGVEVYNRSGDPTPTPQTKHGGVTGGDKVADSPPNLTCLISVPSHHMGHWSGQHSAIITMWEATVLPPGFRENLHDFDTIIVPSQQNVELFSKYHDNVQLMPLGVDPALWHYIAPAPPEREFRFLISGRGSRKGGDLAFKAFHEVFGHSYDWDPAPTLIMKSRQGHSEFFSPQIQQVVGNLSAEEERDLYASAHCYIQPSRGEGFGLQPLQALALGRPTILTNAHGHAGYADLGIGIDWDYAETDEFMFGYAGEWWEPKLEDLCEAMWDVYKNWGTHADRAKANSEIVTRDWTWAKTTDRFVEILGPEMDKPYAGDGTWTTSTRLLYKVITWCDYSCDIAGRQLFFEAGKEYWESADVKRILYDGGKLDNACLEGDDTGLAEIQVEQLGFYRAMHEPCPTCGALDGGGTATQRIEIEMLETELAETQEKLAEALAERVGM